MTMIVTILTLVLLIGTGVIWKKGNGNGLENQRKKDQEAPVEIPENDKNWHLRTDLIEQTKRDLVEQLRSSPSCYVSMEHEGSFLTRGEVYEILMPFLKKGYFAYRGAEDGGGRKVKSFIVTKHRSPGRDELEITQELLSTNAQL